MVLKNKKGLVFSTLVTISIIVISTLILLSIVYKINSKVSGQNIIKQCQLSSAIEGSTSKLLAYVDGGDSSLTVNCPRVQITVDDGKIVSNNLQLNKPKLIDDIGKKDKETTLYTYTTKDTEKVYKVVSDEIASCWNKFNRGSVDVLDFEYSSKNAARSLCFICDEVVINQELPSLDVKPVRTFTSKNKLITPNFHNYFVQTIYKKDLTYLDYMNDVDLGVDTPFAKARLTFINDDAPTAYDTFFTKGVSKLDKGGMFILDDDKNILGSLVTPVDTLDSSTNYYIIFRKPSLHKNSEEKDYFSYIIPSTDLSKYCNEVI